MEKIYYKILNKEQKELLPKLKFLKEEGFYLAGGTALALQLGHRTSIDFDFYGKKQFRPQNLYYTFLKYLPEVEKIRQSWGTLVVKEVKTEISVFYYKFPLIRPLLTLSEGIDILSVEDIAAMKIWAIIQRGIRRDFIDLYFLFQEFGLKKILNFCEEKYPQEFNLYQTILALAYFKDAGGEQQKPRYGLFKNCSWDNLKRDIIKRIEDFKKEQLSK